MGPSEPCFSEENVGDWQCFTGGLHSPAISLFSTYSLPLSLPPLSPFLTLSLSLSFQVKHSHQRHEVIMLI